MQSRMRSRAGDHRAVAWPVEKDHGTDHCIIRRRRRRTRNLKQMNRFVPMLALMTGTVASLVSGCAGMSTSYPTKYIAPPKHITVVPLTPEFIARGRRVE